MRGTTGTTRGRKANTRGRKSTPAPQSSAAVLKRLLMAGSKKFGADVFTTFAKGIGCEIKKHYTTTVPVLDVAITGKVGEGFPSGRLTEVFGEEHCGKSTLALCALAEAQKIGAYAILVDSESTITRKRLRALGLNLDELISAELRYIEDSLNMMIEMARKGKTAPGIMVLDSVAGSMTTHEAGKEVGEQTIGRHAQSLSQGLRKLAPLLAKTAAAVVMINQRKQGGLGQMYATDRERDATLGGKALKFHCHTRLRLLFKGKFVTMTKIGKASKKVYIGDLIKATVIKNKDRGSGTQDCEVLLLLRKVGEGRGRFDNAVSLWLTLRHWNAVKHNEQRLLFKGEVFTLDKWKKRYDTDKTFRKTVHDFLEESAQSLVEEGYVDRPEKETRVKKIAPKTKGGIPQLEEED